MAVFLVSLGVHIQGFNMLDDGLWMVGTKLVAEGGVLYRDLFTIYGPARYYFLLPFFLAFGKSALGLAVARAVCDGLAALVGVDLARRFGGGRWAWLVPFGVVALAPINPRYVAAALLTRMAMIFLSRDPGARRGWLLGLGWGALALFGLDMAGYGGLILGFGLAGLWWQERMPARDLGWFLAKMAAGLAVVLGGALVLALATGSLGSGFWDTVTYPVTRFRGGMGLSWIEVFKATQRLQEPFSPLYTGEFLDAAWWGHAGQRAGALRALYLLIWLVPLAGLGRMWFRRQALLGPLAGFCIAGWVTLLGRGDTSHLTMAWYAPLLILPLLLARLDRMRRPLAVTAAGALALVLLPLAMEHLWLATHLGRDGLSRWDRPQARIFMGTERISGLEKLMGILGAAGRGKVVTWPAQPGMAFMLGSDLATSQATLLAGEVRDPVQVTRELERSRPQVILMGKASGFVPGVRTFRGLAPGIYPYVRRNYIVYGSGSSDKEFFRILLRRKMPPAEYMDMPLKHQLPTAAQNIKVSATDWVTGSASVGQSFMVREFPLHALELELELPVPGPFPLTVPVGLTVMKWLGDGKGVAKYQQIVPVVFEEQKQRVEFRFPPILDSVDTAMAFALTSGDPQAPPFRVTWDMLAEGTPPGFDFYPDGQALVNGRTTGADLYFLAY